MKKETHVIFTMISPENLKAMSLNERSLYVMLVALWNKRFWKDIVISMRELSEFSLLDQRYVNLALAKLEEKGYLKFRADGKTWSKKFTISYVKQNTKNVITDPESFNTDPGSSNTDPESFNTDTYVNDSDTNESVSSAPMSPNSLILNNTIEYPLIPKDSLTGGLADNAQFLTVKSSTENKTALPITTRNETEPVSQPTDELSLEEIVSEETNNKTALPITTKPEAKLVLHLPTMNATAKVVSKNGVPHLVAKVTYRKFQQGVVKPELFNGKIEIPAHQLPHLCRTNEATLVYNWKNDNRNKLLTEREILLDNVYIEYDN